MSGWSTLRRVAGTVRNEVRQGGFAGLCHSTHDWMACRQHYTRIDSCKFDLAAVPNSDVRMQLARKSYESYERDAVRRCIRPYFPIVELGGCLGIVACITDRFKKPSIHVVVEANPTVIPILQSNRALNHCKFEIVNAAIAYGVSTVTFTPNPELPSNSLRQCDGAGAVTVKATQLKPLLQDRGIHQFTLICDIEGHEYDLVQNEAETLESASLIILETHARMIGEEKTCAMMQRLSEIGFTRVEEAATVVVLQRGAATAP
jgi:FkbM family methyltransferase